MPSIPSASVSDAHQKLSSSTSVLIDVRTPGEYRGQHAAAALNLPLDTITPEAVRHAADGATEIFVICQGGKRSMAACEKLSGAGITSLVNVAGGTNAWVEAQLPTLEGKGVISIERQVRIGAGLLVFIGVLLGVWVHPLWLILPGFVGAGLAFAGITDFCGMGLLLAKMPWNK